MVHCQQIPLDAPLFEIHIETSWSDRGSLASNPHFTNNRVVSVIACLGQLPSPNALCVLRYKRSPGPGQRFIARIAPFTRQPSTLRRNVIGAEPFCWAARISHGEVSYEKTAVIIRAARIGDTVCSKPVRWDLDDQTGHGPVSHQAGPILAE